MPEFRDGTMVIPLKGTTATTGGAVGAQINPEGVPIIIRQAILRIATPSTGAATLNVGTAADGVTSDTGLISALTANGALTGKAYNGLNPAAKAEHLVLAAGSYITISSAADTTGLTGELYVSYIRTN
jgi:hypothetical protein